MEAGKREEGNSRIAKNTLFLYVRMMFLMFISLFTSRVVLAQLGVEDFGLYNVVGSLIMMFTFVQGSLSSATSRFLAYEIGNGTKRSINETFCMTMNIHLLFAVFILIISETIGMWYFYNKMVIPFGRFSAALIVYQLSNLNAILAVLVLPYRAMIIAKEEMKSFAYISILEAIIKLFIAFCLYANGIDRLIVYGSLLCLSQIFVNAIYLRYCKRHFEETCFKFFWNKDMFKDMFSFSGWSVCSYLSSSFVSQSFNLMLNAFYGPTVNAARAVSYQVQGAISNFSTNFQIAMNPQIIKNYATKDLGRVYELVGLSMKASFSLLFILMMPVLSNIEWILSIWLKNVPGQTNVFVTIICLCSILSAMANPFSVVAEAANRLKLYNLITMPFYLLSLPIAYILLRHGAQAYWVFIVTLIAECTAFFLKLWIAHKIIAIPVRYLILRFFKHLLFILVVMSLAKFMNEIIAGSLLAHVCNFMFFLFLAICIVAMGVLDKRERSSIINKLRKLCQKQK